MQPNVTKHTKHLTSIHAKAEQVQKRYSQDIQIKKIFKSEKV